MQIINWLRRRFYYSWITFSMILCAAVFFPWFLPRESTSGLLGRWLAKETGWKQSFAIFMSPIIDRIFHKPFGMESCIETHFLEEAAREALYIRGELS